jgi:hypothetical protein
MSRYSAAILGLFIAFGLTPVLSLGAGDDDDPPADQPVPAVAGVFHPPVRLSAADGMLDSGASWGHASPWIVDADGDGVRDLIVGDFSGFFRFYRNEATDARPRYAKAVNLKAGGVDAQVPIY